MRTDFPTVELYFVFAFTYCRLKVYKRNETFAREVLRVANVSFVTKDANETWEEIDTQVLLDMVSDMLQKQTGREI